MLHEIFLHVMISPRPSLYVCNMLIFIINKFIRWADKYNPLGTSKYLIGIGVTSALGFNCYALTLSEAVQLARQGDPTFLSAQANLVVAQERANQAFANVLPQINASGNTNFNHRIYTTTGATSTTFNDRFNSNSAQVNLTQPLFRSANRAAIAQSDATVAQAEYQFVAADQDLLVRLAQAWFEVLSARDQLTYTFGQVGAAKHEFEQAARAAELGIAGPPVREEARLKYEQAVAERAAAESEQAIKFAALELVIGPAAFPTLPALSDQYIPPTMQGDALERWLGLAETSNPTILAGLSALSAAQSEIRKQYAGHEPTVDITGSYGRNAQGSGTFGGQGGFNSTSSAIGLQVNLPIFSGGGQSAKVREAIALRTRAQQDLESARRNARSQGTQAWHGTVASQSRLNAAQRAVQFSTLNLQAALSGSVIGIKKELDVLRGRQQLYGALRDLAKARYDVSLNHFRLKAIVGQLTDEDVVRLDQWLIAPSK